MADNEQVTLKPITLVAGPPGAGKTTVTRRLVEISQGQVALIEGDLFWRFFAKGWEEPGIKKNFTTVMTSMTSASLAYVRAGYGVILDFSVPPWFLPTVLKIISPRGMELNYVVLRPSLEVCKQRIAGREEGAVADYSRFQNLYDSFDAASADCFICDDKSDAETIAARIRAGIDEGIFRVNAENTTET